MDDIDLVLGMLHDLEDEELTKVIEYIDYLRTRVQPSTTGTLTVTKL